MVRRLMKTMAKYKAIVGEEYASTAYTRALDIISSPGKVEEIILSTVGRLPRGIGKGIQSFIAEAIMTGSIAELEEMRRDPRVKAVELLETIIGVGPVTAMKWVSEGTLSIADAANRDDLTSAQKVGVEVHGKVIDRVPRAVVEKIFGDVLAILPAGVNAIITGSYRRGAPSSGDVDILIISDIIVANQLPTIPGSIIINAGEMKMSYLAPMDGMYVQVDIFISPSSSRVAYLSYSTGSAAHNVYLRGLAKSKGYHLSQYSLTDGGGKAVILDSEEDLYNALGVDYVPPEKR